MTLPTEFEMIEVVARLTQGVYLAGETVECAVTLRNPSPPPGATSQWNDQEEILAWASVQIHCKCWVSQNRVTVPEQASLSKEEQAVANSRTSFAPCTANNMFLSPAVEGSTSQGSGALSSANSAARVVISTKPFILFCDLRLLPGECKTCE